MKAQFEAMGLALIVVLMSLGMFFLLFFSMRSQVDFVQRYNNEQLAQNLVESMLKTDAKDGCINSVQDIIEDNVVLHRNICGDSAVLLDTAASTILARTLDDRGVKYDFIINTRDTLVYNHSNCDSTNRDTDHPGQTRLRFLPSLTDVNVTLWICVK